MKTKRYRKYKKFYRKYKNGNGYATKKYVKKLFDKNIENKFLDLNEVPTNIVQGIGFLERLTPISQGTTDVTRIGDKVRLKALFLDYQIVCSDATNLVRVVVFQWHPQTNLVAATLTEIFQYFAIGDNREVLSPYVHDYGDQFRVLYDRLYTLDLASAYTKSFKGVISLKRAKKQMAYAAGGSQGSNQLYIAVLSDSSAASHPTFTYVSRVIYEDA